MSDSNDRGPDAHEPPVAALVDDYLTTRETLATLRREVALAAEREAHGIVATARADIEHALLRAQRELAMLRAQVAAVGTDPTDYASLAALSENVEAARRLLGQDSSDTSVDTELVLSTEVMPRNRGRRLVAIASVMALISVAALAGVVRYGGDTPEMLTARSLAPMALAVPPAVADVPAAIDPAAGVPDVAAPAATVEELAAPPPTAARAAAARPQPPAAAETAAAPADWVIPPPPPGLETVGPAEDVELIRTAAQHWLDAYYRGDQVGMRAISGVVPAIADERPETFRQAGDTLDRRLDNITTQVIRGNALYTARLVESGGGGQHISFVSQLWSRASGSWQLVDVRIVDQAAVRPTAQ